MLIGGQLKLAFSGCRVSKRHIDFAPFPFLAAFALVFLAGRRYLWMDVCPGAYLSHSVPLLEGARSKHTAKSVLASPLIQAGWQERSQVLL